MSTGRVTLKATVRIYTMNWQFRHDKIEANENGLGLSGRVMYTHGESQPALTPRLVGPEANAA
jgi:hypothetical protein